MLLETTSHLCLCLDTGRPLSFKEEKIRIKISFLRLSFGNGCFQSPQMPKEKGLFAPAIILLTSCAAASSFPPLNKRLKSHVLFDEEVNRPTTVDLCTFTQELFVRFFKVSQTNRPKCTVKGSHYERGNKVSVIK